MIEEHSEPGRRAQMLGSEQRRKWLRADDLIKDVAGITRGMTCVDLGCGAGAFSFPIVDAVGDEGTVYAVDNDAKVLERIRSKNPPPNLIMVHTDASQTGLESEIADFCFMVLILHEAEQPDVTMAEAFHLLKPEGKALVVEWREDSKSPLRPGQEKIPRERMEQLFKQAGLSSFEYIEWSRNHYIAIGIKNKSV